MNSLHQKLIMYYKIHELRADKLSISQICEQVELNWRTVKSYLQMSEPEYLSHIEKQKHRDHVLKPYTDFVFKRIDKYSLTSAAQIHDLLKEKYPDFPQVSSKTVYNFTMWVRQEFHLPKINGSRAFESIEEQPYGKQAQVDYGVYNMQNKLGKRQKVWFFCLSLSRSRYKFVFFSQIHFTTQTTIEAHDKGFEFFYGIPQCVIYDQDKLMISDENLGDYILTKTFKKYTTERKFKLHFCRKADPQSKGMVENNVKYVKQNFLYGRIFDDIDTLNQEAINWLNRTANAMPHGTTTKIPHNEWLIEKSYLTPFTNMILPQPELPLYSLRKDNTISFKGNFYSVPLGTYSGRGTQVMVQQTDSLVIVFSTQKIEIARHKLARTKGNKIINTNHKRDRTSSIDELLELVVAFFDQTELAKIWLGKIRKKYPRYIRDHLLVIKKEVAKNENGSADIALVFCSENKLYSATDFKDVMANQNAKINKIKPEQQQEIKTIAENKIEMDDFTPQVSDINIYESIINNHGDN